MKEFFLFIHSDAEAIDRLLQDDIYMKKVHHYIYNLASKGHMIDVKPINMEGALLSCEGGRIVQTKYPKNMNGNAGYVHFTAASMEEAIAIGREHPILEFCAGKVEVRPLKVITV